MQYASIIIGAYYISGSLGVAVTLRVDTDDMDASRTEKAKRKIRAIREIRVQKV